MNIALNTREFCHLTDFWASLYILVDCATILYAWSGVLFEQLSLSTGHEIP